MTPEEAANRVQGLLREIRDAGLVAFGSVSAGWGDVSLVISDGRQEVRKVNL